MASDHHEDAVVRQPEETHEQQAEAIHRHVLACLVMVIGGIAESISQANRASSHDKYIYNVQSMQNIVNWVLF